VTKIERAVERFCALKAARGFKSEYVKRYRNDLASLVGFLERRGKADLREAVREDLVEYLRWLDRRYARTTVRLRLWRLRRLLFFLQGDGLLLRNPAADLVRKPSPSRMRDWLTAEEAARLLETPDTTKDLGVRDRAALELLYSSGLRLSELLRLELDDLDLGEGFVTVKESKAGRGRRVPVGRTAVKWLARYLRDVRPRLLAGAAGKRTLAVFLSDLGTPLDKRTLGYHVHRYGRRAGLEKTVTPHVFRHSFAIHLLQGGASTRHIQAMLGHRSLEATQIYARVFPADLVRAHRRSHPSERLPKPRHGE
jgi:integrase/recombinase XerD